jgi:hypothetical protein
MQRFDDALNSPNECVGTVRAACSIASAPQSLRRKSPSDRMITVRWPLAWASAASSGNAGRDEAAYVELVALADDCARILGP